jgi:hypothetical protein
MFYLKESFLKTKDIYVFMKFILIMIILSLFVLPFGSFQDHISNSLHDVRVFKEYSSL